MRFFKNSLVMLLLVIIFGVSFLVGRISAVRSSEERARLSEAAAERAVAILPLLRSDNSDSSEGEAQEIEELPASAQAQNIFSAAAEEEEAEEEEQPPCPIPSPVKGDVSQAYSLQAVYSQTMQDWRSHMGIDIDAPLSSAVTAPADGTVTKAYTDKLWGNVIEIEHKGSLKTVYKGVSTLDMVRVGEQVRQGDIISGVGTSPIESKAMAHLHFETWLDGVCVNPEFYVVE